MSNKYYYPAVFEEDTENGGYGVFVPDIPGCISQGETFDEAVEMLQEAMGMMLEDYPRDHYPTPSKPDTITLEGSQFVTVVAFDQTAYDKKYHSKAVKKTLSIPSWLNEEALAKNVNFSNVLQNALIRELGLS